MLRHRVTGESNCIGLTSIGSFFAVLEPFECAAMPPKLPWTLAHAMLTGPELTRVVDDMRRSKAMRVTASNVMSCRVCASPIPHVMRYQILECRSQACAGATTPNIPCPWRCKLLKCLSKDAASVYTCREHLVPDADLPAGKLTTKQRDMAGALAAHGLKPLQILNRVAIETPTDEMPKLQKLQHFVAYYRKSRMFNTDDLDELEQMIKAGAFTGDEPEDKAFFFSIHTDGDDKPHVGDGSDEDPFVIGITTKALLRRMDRDPDSFVFHMDTTFKLNIVDYPTLICGISDGARSFHVVAFFVISQRQTVHCTSALTSLSQIYTKVASKPLRLRFVMGDADDAQFNAMKAVFRDSDVEYLMCFFHVVSKLPEHCGSTPGPKVGLVFADLYDMHCAKSASNFLSKKTAAVRRWLSDPDVAEFGQYIFRQWLTGRFSRWQCYRTPVGFATTNNPIEQYNDKVKTIYTARQRLKMGMLLFKLSEGCSSECTLARDFATAATANSKLRTRARHMSDMGYLVEIPPIDGDADDTDDTYVMVLSLQVPRVPVTTDMLAAIGIGSNGKGKRKKTVRAEVLEAADQLNVNDARMERDDQPESGWAVNVRERTCPCKYFFKHGQCVHLLFALHLRYGNDQPPRRTLVMRGKRSKKRSFADAVADALAATRASAGRPILNGPALSFD